MVRTPDGHPSRTGPPDPLLPEVRRLLSTEQAGRGMLKAWSRRAVRQVVKLYSLTDALREVRNSRDFSHQVRLMRMAGCGSGAGELGAAVIRHNRLMISFERTFLGKRARCDAVLVLMQSELTPGVLLDQARREWQLLMNDKAGRFVDAGTELIRQRKLRAVIERLMELMDLLHPDLPIPAVVTWVQDRIEYLRLQQLRLMMELDHDPSPV